MVTDSSGTLQKLALLVPPDSSSIFLFPDGASAASGFQAIPPDLSRLPWIIQNSSERGSPLDAFQCLQVPSMCFRPPRGSFDCLQTPPDSLRFLWVRSGSLGLHWMPADSYEFRGFPSSPSDSIIPFKFLRRLPDSNIFYQIL